MNMTNIKLIIFILVVGFVYSKDSAAQWQNTIDQQHQNAIMKNQQDDAIRQHRWNDMNNRMIQEEARIRRLQQQEYINNENLYQFRQYNQHNLYHRGY